MTDQVDSGSQVDTVHSRSSEENKQKEEEEKKEDDNSNNILRKSKASDIATPASATGSGSMDSDEEFMSGASSADDILETQDSDVGSMDGMFCFLAGSLFLLASLDFTCFMRIFTH